MLSAKASDSETFIIRDNSIAQHIAIPEFISKIFGVEGNVKSICEIKLSILHEPFDVVNQKKNWENEGS